MPRRRSIALVSWLVIGVAWRVPPTLGLAIRRLPSKPRVTTMIRSFPASSVLLVAAFCFAPGLLASEASVRSALGQTAPAQADATDSAAPAPLQQVSDADLAALLQKVQATLDRYRTQSPNTRENDPWEIMHWIVAYGVDTEVRLDGPTGDPMTAIGYLCFNGRANGRRLLSTNEEGVLPLRGPGQQGHDGQFLAILAQSRLMIDYPLQVGEEEFTIADLIEFEKRTCRPRSELTFKLIGLSHYLDTDATWTSETGAPWSISRLIEEEIAQPIRGATCGGTHRLLGLSFALHNRRRENKPIDGQFKRAEAYLADYHNYTLRLQNNDGSFSTNFASGRGESPDPTTRLYTTGHTLEWMAFSAPDELLADPRMVRSVDYLCGLLETSNGWEYGALGHALHGLSIYHGRATKLAMQSQAQTASE
jgi:hypothetical protein